MNDILLHTDQLTVGYHDEALIRDITFSVRAGQILTLIGPNGAGKSTILKSISRQLAPLAGTVFLQGKALTELPRQQLAQTMSILMTQRLETEWMRCIDVVESGRYPYTGRLGILSDDDRNIAQEALRLVHGEALAQWDFRQLSDGQRQRILLAKAICQEPEVLILDEPTSFLDIRYQLELLQILKELVHTRRIAVVLSLHELDLAQKLSDLVACVHGDRIERIGTPDEIFTGDYIASLYEMTCGSYDSYAGTPELPPPPSSLAGAVQESPYTAGCSGRACRSTPVCCRKTIWIFPRHVRWRQRSSPKLPLNPSARRRFSGRHSVWRSAKP